MADLAVAGPCGMGGLGAGLRVRQPVATVPAAAAILGREDAVRRNADPDFVGIGRVEQDRMQDQSGAAGIPTAGRRMIARPCVGPIGSRLFKNAS